ncbi:MAG: GNAT family N-acetyltransferase [Gaiellaceae bacterium]
MSSDGELGLSVRAIEDDDRAWLHETVLATWRSNRMWVSGRLVDDVSALPGLLAERAGERVGYVLVTPDAEGAQVIALESLQPRRGVATALLAGLQEEARRLGWSRLWLTTTNDNLDAIRLYQRRGWELVAFHRDSVTAGRRLKPEIPERGAYGIAIRHELEFEAPTR